MYNINNFKVIIVQVLHRKFPQQANTVNLFCNLK